MRSTFRDLNVDNRSSFPCQRRLIDLPVIPSPLVANGSSREPQNRLPSPDGTRHTCKSLRKLRLGLRESTGSRPRYLPFTNNRSDWSSRLSPTTPSRSSKGSRPFNSKDSTSLPHTVLRLRTPKGLRRILMGRQNFSKTNDLQNRIYPLFSPLPTMSRFESRPSSLPVFIESSPVTRMMVISLSEYWFAPGPSSRLW